MIFDHEARKGRIGASEIAAILGLNEYMTPLDVWMVKTGRKPHFEGNEHTRRGQRQERQILEWMAEDLGLSPYMEFKTQPTTIYEPWPIAAATPDGFVYLGDEIELLEAKSTLARVKCIEDINVSHLIQCQWQMMVTGLKKCHLGIFGPMVSDYQRFEIAYDEALAMELLAQAREWWERHIIQDVQPEPINTEDALALWPVDDGSTIEAVPSLYEAINQYKEVNEQIKALTKRKDDLKDRITPAIESATVVKFAGMTVATYKHQSKKEYTVKASETRVLRT